MPTAQNSIATPTPKRRGRPPGSVTKARIAAQPRLGFRINEFAAMHGVSRSTVLGAIRRGQLRTRQIGTCRIILADQST